MKTVRYKNDSFGCLAELWKMKKFKDVPTKINIERAQSSSPKKKVDEKHFIKENMRTVMSINKDMQTVMKKQEA